MKRKSPPLFNVLMIVGIGALLLGLIPDTSYGLTLVPRGAPNNVITTLTGSAGNVDVDSVPDAVSVTGAFTSNGTITNPLSSPIPVARIQYDILNSTVGILTAYTVSYAPGTNVIGAETPDGFFDSSGAFHSFGGTPFTTLFNNGYGLYYYNNTNQWVIDYEPTYLRWTNNLEQGLTPGAGNGEYKRRL